ncbi:hypothetical protein AOLI_G00020520 [Acnodon oligacanthus]
MPLLCVIKDMASSRAEGEAQPLCYFKRHEKLEVDTLSLLLHDETAFVRGQSKLPEIVSLHFLRLSEGSDRNVKEVLGAAAVRVEET